MNNRSNRARLGAAVAWLAPLVAGAVVRLWNLPRQILLDDEMHTVLTSLYLPVREILSSWKSEDPCLPLAALYRSLLESGVVFSEMTFRAPVLAASLATILVLPWLARPLYGQRIALLLAWLLAVSPVLSIYGGMVRPYGVIALLAPAATLAVMRWRGSGRLGWGLVYAVLAPLCLWFHLATAPLLAAPFALLAIESLLAIVRGSRGRPHEENAAGERLSDGGGPVSIRDLAIAAAVALTLVAALLVPTWHSLRELYSGKSGIAPFSFELVPPIARLQAGIAMVGGAMAITALFWSVAAVGLVLLGSRRPGLVIYPLASTLAQWVGLAILAPIGLLNPIIFNRYLIGTLPLVLLGVAAGLDAIVECIRTKSNGRLAAPASLLAPAVFLVVLVLAGPYGDASFRRSSFQHSKDFIRFDLPRGVMAAAAVPPFYDTDSVRGKGFAILEFPFRGGWSATRAHYVYQSIHRGPVLGVEPYAWPCDDRLRLRNHVCSRPAALLASPARFLVVHRDPLAEESPIMGGDDSGNRYQPEEWEKSARTAGRMARSLRQRWGAASYHDERMTAWDLEEVRRRMIDGQRAAKSKESDATH